MRDGSTTVITGAGSGFGLALARRLLGLGQRVVALDEDAGPAWVEALASVGSDRALCLVADVRRDADVDHAVGAALRFGPVDVLVNNAGYALFATQEEGPVEGFRDLLDVNVLGPTRVTRALLPSIRARRGAIVQLSSVAGRTVFPESGFYAATKHALEAMTEALAQEVCTFGVRVRLIEPGSFATGFLARAAAESPPLAPSSPYAGLRERWADGKRAVLEPPQDPELVVDAIIASLADPSPFRRVAVGPDAERILALRDRLGADPWTRLALDRNGLDAVEAPPAHGPADVPSAAEALALPDADPRLALAAASAAAGHLDHWARSEVGRRALGRLGTAADADGS